MGVFQKRDSTAKPLPLKQRTSSKDARRDYSHNTWISLLVLLKAREFFVTVDNFSLWRRHLAWAMENGKDLRGYMTQRYASNMVFMSLLLSTELGVLFNSAPVTTDVRLQLIEGQHDTVSFWAGMMLIISALLTLLSLISTFTAWAMVNAVDESNAHCIFRSSIGQYAAELPGRLIVCSIYSFLISFMLFFFLLLPFGLWSLLLLLVTSFLFIHIVSVFSAFGRVIMHTGAMGKSRIFTPEYEEFLVPHSLHHNLLIKARANLANNTSIIRQYRRKQKPIDRTMTDDEMFDHLNDTATYNDEPSPNLPYRPRADSTVRFADQEIGYFPPPPPRSSHMRNMSQLSDISSRQDSDRSLLTTPSMGVSSTRNTPLPSPLAAVPSRSPPPPLLMTAHGAPLRNVSSSSLEQWLQASPQGEETQTSTASNAESRFSNNQSSYSSMPTPPPKPDTTRTSYAIAGRPQTPISSYTNDDRDLSEDDRFAMGYPLPSPLRTVSNTSIEQWLQASPQGGEETRKPNVPPPPVGEPSSSTNRASSLTMLPPRPKLVTRSRSGGGTRPPTPKPQDVNFDDRDLSEDERFTMDYGDFDNDESPQTLPEDYEVVDGSGGGETTSLLDSGNRSNYYSSTSGDPFSSSRKKSPPPPPPTKYTTTG